jgi:hypothetical protein
LRTIEQYPERQVIGKAFEAVLPVRRYEQHVAGAEGDELVAVVEPAAAAHHDVDLVPGVRRLGIGVLGRVQADLQRAMLQQHREVVAIRAGHPGEGLRQRQVECRHVG